MLDFTSSSTKLTRLLTAAVVGVSSVTFAAQLRAADEVVTLVPTTTQSTFFSDDEVTYVLELNAQQAVTGKVTWDLSSLHRTLSRGEVAVEIDAGKPRLVKLRLKMPHIKAGVIDSTVLSARFHIAGEHDSSATFERDLWVYSPGPFVDRTQWLEALELQLYDRAGGLAKIFAAAKIPCQGIRTIAELEAIESGIVIVADGSRRDAVAETVLNLAESGRRVLWFAPEACELELPGSEQFAGKRPKELLFRQSDNMEWLDKRLDPNAWADVEESKSVGLKMVARRNRTFLEIGPPDQGWVWLQAKYSDPDGQLILCGLSLVDTWDASPTPRYMLASLLEQLDHKNSKTDVTEEKGQ